MTNITTIQVSEQCSLELINSGHATHLLKLTNANRAHLRQWLTWVDNMQTVDDFSTYIASAQQRFKEGTELNFVIIYNGQVAGRIGLHAIDKRNRLASVGYWVGKEFSGKGLVTASCAALISFGFDLLNLNRIELRCGVENSKSKAIAERLLFIFEGVLRQAEWLNNDFVDLNCYALLKMDWKRH